MRSIPGWNANGNTYSQTFSSDTNSLSGSIDIYDNTGNTTLVNYGELKIDTTIPTSLDVSVSHPNNTDFLATDAQNIRVNVSENG